MLRPCLQSWPCREKSPRQGVQRPQPFLPLPLNSSVGLWVSHLLSEPQHLHHFRNRAVTKVAGIPLREHPHNSPSLIPAFTFESAPTSAQRSQPGVSEELMGEAELRSWLLFTPVSWPHFYLSDMTCPAPISATVTELNWSKKENQASTLTSSVDSHVLGSSAVLLWSLF